MRDLLAGYLGQHGFEIAGTARNGAEALDLVHRTGPEVALVDVRMPAFGGVELARRLSAEGAPTAVAVYVDPGAGELPHYALDAGARGLVQKDAPLEEVVRALQFVAEGGIWIDPALSSSLIETESAERLRTLTARQRAVLERIADGMTTEEIGRSLFVSPDTVRVHLRNAMAILHAKTRPHAVAKALRQSLIS